MLKADFMLHWPFFKYLILFGLILLFVFILIVAIYKSGKLHNDIANAEEAVLLVCVPSIEEGRFTSRFNYIDQPLLVFDFREEKPLSWSLKMRGRISKDFLKGSAIVSFYLKNSRREYYNLERMGIGGRQCFKEYADILFCEWPSGDVGVASRDVLIYDDLWGMNYMPSGDIWMAQSGKNNYEEYVTEKFFDSINSFIKSASSTRE